MKKTAAILTVVMLAAAGAASADVLSNNQLSGIYAGEVDTDINDDIFAEISAVANQKNIGVIGSTDDAVSNASIDNENIADVANTGDSAMALQTNIGAISFGAGLNEGNSVTNANDAIVDNTAIVPDGSVDGISDGSTQSGAGNNATFATVFATQSAVVSQNNVGAIAGGGVVDGASIVNSNLATVTNTVGAL